MKLNLCHVASKTRPGVNLAETELPTHSLDKSGQGHIVLNVYKLLARKDSCDGSFSTQLFMLQPFALALNDSPVSCRPEARP